MMYVKNTSVCRENNSTINMIKFVHITMFQIGKCSLILYNQVQLVLPCSLMMDHWILIFSCFQLLEGRPLILPMLQMPPSQKMQMPIEHTNHEYVTVNNKTRLGY